MGGCVGGWVGVWVCGWVFLNSHMTPVLHRDDRGAVT